MPSAPSWLRPIEREGGAPARLLCCSHAGGGASSFNAWRRHLPHEIELVKLQMPGREDSPDLHLYTDMRELLPRLYPHIEELFDRPLFIYGHSVGALVAFELIREMRRRGRPMPLAYFVSSRRSPRLPLRPVHLLYNLPDEQLVQRLEELGGAPPGMFSTRKWRDYYLPRIRADLELTDRYVYQDEARLEVPVHAFIGEDDDLVAHEDWEDWQEVGRGDFSRRILRAGHFFSGDALIELIAEIVRIMRERLDQHEPSRVDPPARATSPSVHASNREAAI